MAKMGRPKINIDKERFESYCHIQCTRAEIAFLFNCSDDTICRWCQSTYGKTFAATFKKLSAHGKMSLRRAMFKNAIKNDNATLQIWLSKQYLGMRDKHDVEVDVQPFVLLAPNGDEVMRIGAKVGELEGEVDEDLIDVEAIEDSEQRYYDSGEDSEEDTSEEEQE